MTATNHVVTGALIATYIHNPWVALPVAFAAHFALDSLPHCEPPGKPNVLSFRFAVWLATDCGLAASILLTILLLHPPMVWLLLACGVACASPDLMWLYYLIYKKGHNQNHWPWLANFHGRIQKYTSPKLWPVELAWFLVAGGLLASRLY